jgi:indolepyruvate ferredoxin oxidoreductase
VNRYVDAGAMTRGLHGDASTANIFLLGVAVQAGCLPISAAAVEQAIDLNGVAVEANVASFRWGRRWVVDPAAVTGAAGLDRAVSASTVTGVHVGPLPDRLGSRIEELGDELGAGPAVVDLMKLLAADLVGYQDAGYASRFLDDVALAARAERRVKPGSTELTEAVARGLHKLLAYKDEYEVARLLIGPEARAAAESVGGRGAKVRWRLHPPMLRALGMSGKIALPAAVATPAMRVLAAGKRLRGTPLDPFGRAEVRRVERALAGEYTAAVRKLLDGLSLDSFDRAVATANLALEVRGYEHLKLERAAGVRARLAEA